MLDISYFLVWVITKISFIRFLKKNFKIFYTVFWIDSCIIDSLVPIFQANWLSMIRFRIDSRIDSFRRIEHPYIFNTVWRYFSVNPAPGRSDCVLVISFEVCDYFWYLDFWFWLRLRSRFVTPSSTPIR